MNNCKIIMYHYVRSLQNTAYPKIKGLETSRFQNQLNYFNNNFEFGDFSDVFNSLYKNTEIQNKIILTFDDGLKDHFTTVYPILKKMNIKGYFFPPSKPVEENIVLDVHKIHFILASTNINKIIKEIFNLINENQLNYDLKPAKEYFNELAIPNRFDSKEIIFVKRILQREFPLDLRTKITDYLFKKFVTNNEQEFSKNLYMSISEMKEMSESGMVFGSHSHSHYWLSKINRVNLIEEIDHSKEFCYKIDKNNDELIMCYPYGDFNNEVIEEISKRGFKAGLTTNVGDAVISQESIFKLNRYDTNDFPQ